MSLLSQHRQFKEQLRTHGILFQEDFPLSEITTVRIGPRVTFRVQPETQDQLLLIAQAAKLSELPIWIHGQGSNCLFAMTEDPYPGVLIEWLSATSTFPKPIDSDADVLLTDLHSGIRKVTLGRYCLEHRLEAGLWLIGIPGTLGGGIAMNAGTPQGEFKDITTGICRVDLSLERVERVSLTPDDFAYRQQVCCGPTHLITAATFELKRTQNPGQFRKTCKQTLHYRKKTQPLSEYSFGSTFKNPPGQHAAQLIERAGLKGTRIGQTGISTRHANFFINLGQASAQDMLALIERAQLAVFERCGIRLEPEIRIVKEFYALR